jgi:Domain of unknown function (DUF5110)
VLRVYDGNGAGGRFTVYEDDGETRSSPLRTTEVVQRREGDEIVVMIGAAGKASGLADVRPLRIELVSPLAVSGVTEDGVALPSRPSPSRTEPGWAVDQARRTVYACIPDADVPIVRRPARLGSSEPDLPFPRDRLGVTWRRD